MHSQVHDRLPTLCTISAPIILWSLAKLHSCLHRPSPTWMAQFWSAAVRLLPRMQVRVGRFETKPVLHMLARTHTHTHKLIHTYTYTSQYELTHTSTLMCACMQPRGVAALLYATVWLRYAPDAQVMQVSVCLALHCV